MSVYFLLVCVVNGFTYHLNFFFFFFFFQAEDGIRDLTVTGVQTCALPILCRTEMSLPPEIRKKLALFCNVHINSVIEAMDADTIYDVPILMRKEKLEDRKSVV